MSGLQQLMDGVSKMEEKKTLLTGGAQKVAAGVLAADNALKTLQGTVQVLSAGVKEGIEKLKSGVDTLKQNVDGKQDELTTFTSNLNTYVTKANAIIGQVAGSGTTTTPGTSEGTESTGTQSAEVNVSVDVSFADANPDAIASLESSITGNEAVLASLKDCLLYTSKVALKEAREESGILHCPVCKGILQILPC